jgi:AAA domain
MTEATGFEAKTIHRLLEVDPKGGGFKRGDDDPLYCDLLVVDETSMVDVMLMQALMKAVPDKAALLIVGDIQPVCPNDEIETTRTRMLESYIRPHFILGKGLDGIIEDVIGVVRTRLMKNSCEVATRNLHIFGHNR